MRAYVEIDLEAGRDTLAAAKIIRSIKGVREAYAVSEHCDIFTVVEESDINAIYRLVMRNIRTLKGVTDTRILACIDIEQDA